MNIHETGVEAWNTNKQAIINLIESICSFTDFVSFAAALLTILSKMPDDERQIIKENL